MRISKNKFIKLIPIKEHECRAQEEYLEEKALQGWMLEDIVCVFLIFKKNKSKKCKFRIDIFTDNNKDEYKNSESVDNEVDFNYEICKSKYQWVLDKTFKSYLKKNIRIGQF